MMKQIEDAFNDADLDKDGQLATEDEFKAFQKTLEEQARARQSFVDDREDKLCEQFRICARINPDTVGMSLADFFTIMKVAQPYLLSVAAEIEAKHPMKP